MDSAAASEGEHVVGDAELRVEKTRFDRKLVLHQVKPYFALSTARGLFAIAWCWAWIVAAVAGALWFNHPLAYLVAFVIVAGRQVALFVIVHEAAHYRLIPSHLWSERIVNFCAAYPLCITVDAYRRHHLRHHQFLNTDRDPDWLQHQNEFWSWPKSRRQCLLTFAQDLLGFRTKQVLGLYRVMSPWVTFARLSTFDRVSWFVFVAVVVGVVLASGGYWVLLGLWILPNFTLVFALHHLRTVAEHLALKDTHELNASRTVVSSPLERFLIAPLGINYHLEHHLFPGVPSYHLPQVHRLLKNCPEFRAHAHLTSSYLGWKRGLISEMVAAQGAPHAAAQQQSSLN